MQCRRECTVMPALQQHCKSLAVRFGGWLHSALCQPHEGAYAAFVTQQLHGLFTHPVWTRGPQFSATAAVPSKRHIVVHAMPKRSAMMQQQSCGGTVTACDLRPYGNLQPRGTQGDIVHT